MHIGPLALADKLLLAPMAGVSDRPFRQLCRHFGAALAASEMVSSRPDLRHSRKTRQRTDHQGEPGPIAVQIVGADPAQLAAAARYNTDRGAEIIDINMGCPARKVCNVAAGSALLRDEVLVGRILDAVVAAVDVPVTLKIRTGWSPEQRNAVRIARIAEAAGIQALVVHGRTRADAFRGEAEYETIRAVKQSVRIPVVANGDIDGPLKAAQVLQFTGADGLMVGRAARGRPWIFREIALFLRTGRPPEPLGPARMSRVVLDHVHALHEFYGPEQGLRIARKHLKWYSGRLSGGGNFWQNISRVANPTEQLARLTAFLESAATHGMNPLTA